MSGDTKKPLLGKTYGGQAFGANNSRCALGRRLFMQKRNSLMDSGLCTIHGETGKPQGTAAHEGQVLEAVH